MFPVGYPTTGPRCCLHRSPGVVRTVIPLMHRETARFHPTLVPCEISDQTPARDSGGENDMRGIGCVITYPFYFRCLLRKTCLTPALRAACLYVHFSPVMLTFALDSCSVARGRKCQTAA